MSLSDAQERAIKRDPRAMIQHAGLFRDAIAGRVGVLPDMRVYGGRVSSTWTEALYDLLENVEEYIREKEGLR